MASRPRQKRQDDSTRMQAAPVAEAIAIGTAVGGLVIGTMQATATEAAVTQARNAGPSLDQRDAGATGNAVRADVVSASNPSEHAPSHADGIAQQATVVADTLQQEPADMSAPAFFSAGPVPAVEAATPAPAADIDTVVANTIPLPVQTQLVVDLSEQITSTLIKVIGNAEGGLPVSNLGQSIANEIIQSAQEIVAGIDIRPMLDAGTLTDEIAQKIDAPGIIDNALAATSGIANSVVTEVSGLPASILGATNELSSLPSALLGNEGPDDVTGLLSTLFYPDGASDDLAIPNLSGAAGSLVSGLGNLTIGMLGISYLDIPDHSGSGLGINALSLL